MKTPCLSHSPTRCDAGNYAPPTSSLERLTRLQQLVARPVGLLSAAAALLLAAPAQAQVAAKPADSFVESIGVNTHWSYPSYSNYAQLKVLLGESGIRYIRDGAYPGNTSKYNDLYSTYGIRTNVLLGRRYAGNWPQPLDLSQIGAELNDVKALNPAAIASLENPNEYDLSHGDQETDWVTKIRDYTKEVYTKAKADAALKNYTIIAPSFTEPRYFQSVGSLDPWIDNSCVHHYQSYRHPGSGGWGDNGYGSIDWVYANHVKLQSPAGKPVQSTECGYHNDYQLHPRKDKDGNIIKDASGNTTYYLNYGVSEEAEGKYTARMFAEFFRRGYVRSYKYELFNQGSSSKEDVFGLVRNDLTVKPAYKAVKNLISVLSDKGAGFTPGSLSYTLTGSTSNVRQILFQKRNGDFYLMLWLEVPSWETKETRNSANQLIGAQSKDLYPASQSVSLALPNTIKTATVYQLDNKADMTTTAATITNSAVSLSVSDKIMIVKLAAGTVTSTPNPPATGTFNGVYKLTARHSGKALDVSDASTADGAQVLQWDYKGSLNQQWTISAYSDGTYKLLARHSGKALDVNGGSTADGAKVQQWADKGNSAQRWKITATSDGYYTLTNVASGKVLDVKGGATATANGVVVQQYTANGGTNQQWKLELISSSASTGASAAQLAVTTSQALSLYPNPTTDPTAADVTVSYAANKAQEARLTVTNSLGQVVHSQVVRLRPGQNEVRLQAAYLREGVHTVRLAADGLSHTQRLQVAR